MKLKIFNDKNEVAKAFSEHLKTLIETSESEIHVALSGGSTPKAIFDYMAASYKDSIQWNKLHLYWGDERCVDPTDSESNYRMTVDHLLSKVDFPEKNIHRILGENEPSMESVRYGNLLNKQLPLNEDGPVFNLVILGMGDDGHTASIFPYNIELWDSENNCEVALHPDSGQKRVTLTGNVINNAEEVAFLVTGDNKAEKVESIVNELDGFEVYPASLVAPYSENLSWFLDKAAAAKLDI